MGKISIILISLFWMTAMTSCGGEASDKNTKSKTNDRKPDYSKLYEFYHDDPQNLTEREDNAIIDFIVEKEWDAFRTSRGIYVRITEEGVGPRLREGEDIKVDYKGYFLDGNVFDSTHKRGEPMKFKVGEMVAGFNMGLKYLKSGGQGSIIIPSRFAYGPKGLEGFVPPNTVLVFEVDVLY